MLVTCPNKDCSLQYSSLVCPSCGTPAPKPDDNVDELSSTTAKSGQRLLLGFMTIQLLISFFTALAMQDRLEGHAQIPPTMQHHYDNFSAIAAAARVVIYMVLCALLYSGFRVVRIVVLLCLLAAIGTGAAHVIETPRLPLIGLLVFHVAFFCFLSMSPGIHAFLKQQRRKD